MVHVSPTELLPDFLGATLDEGRLKVIDRLGSGAYGVVYKALDTSSPSDRPVYYAVKCLKKYDFGSREAVFQARELKLHRAVSDHPNVVTIHRHFTDGNHIFVVLDFCEGDLFVAITDKRLFYRNTDLVKNAFAQILDAVEHCHAHHVYHRDLKPENILCDDQGLNVRLADFGLATSSGTSRDFGLGSPYYMSPEALDMRPNGHFSCRHSDIWSLGVILTNLISGRNPWRTAEPSDDCYAAYLNSNNFLIQSLPISEGANTILQQCFNHYPLSRPSIAQIREAVLNLDTFFLSEEELAHASPGQRAIAEYYSSHSPEDADCEATLYDNPKSRSSQASPIDPEEVYLYNDPPFGSPQLLAPPASAQLLGDSSSVSSGDVSSDGPPTPATHPAEPTVDIEVPDLTEDQRLDESAVIYLPGPAKVAAKPTHISAPDYDDTESSRSVFKRAIRRFKAMGS